MLLFFLLRGRDSSLCVTMLLVQDVGSEVAAFVTAFLAFLPLCLDVELLWIFAYLRLVHGREERRGATEDALDFRL